MRTALSESPQPLIQSLAVTAISLKVLGELQTQPGIRIAHDLGKALTGLAVTRRFACAQCGTCSGKEA